MKTIQEICKEQINKFKDFMVSTVEADFIKKGELEPSVYALVMQKNGETTVAMLQNIAPLFESPHGKQIAAEIIRKSAQEIKPIALAFASEAWIAKVDADVLFDAEGNPRKSMPTASDMDNKIEGVFINIETFEQECMKMWKVSQKGDKRILIEDDSPFDWKAKDKKIPSVFSDLLTENYSQMVKILEDNPKINLN